MKKSPPIQKMGFSGEQRICLRLVMGKESLVCSSMYRHCVWSGLISKNPCFCRNAQADIGRSLLFLLHWAPTPKKETSLSWCWLTLKKLEKRSSSCKDQHNKQTPRGVFFLGGLGAGRAHGDGQAGVAEHTGSGEMTRGPYGDHTGTIRGPYGGHTGTIRGPYGAHTGPNADDTGAIRGPYGDHTGPIRGPYGAHTRGPHFCSIRTRLGAYGDVVHTGTLQGPYGDHTGTIRGHAVEFGEGWGGGRSGSIRADHGWGDPGERTGLWFGDQGF